MTEQYDTDALRTAAGLFWSQSQRLTEALQCLDRGLPGMTAMCGADDPGRQFASKFKPSADQLHKFLSDMAEGVRSAGDGLRTMASNIDGADDHSTVPGS